MRNRETRVPRRPASRPGFSLLEMMVSLVILMIVSSVSMALLRGQTRLFAAQGGRAEAEGNARFAISSLERELRMAGAGVVPGQPMLVAAGAMSVVFNVDLVTRTPGDVGSVNLDMDADSNTVGVWRATSAQLLPGTSFTYPETTYMKAAGVESGAETIAYYLALDTASHRSNEYILYRQVNSTAPQVVTRGIVHTAADTVFQYFKSDTVGNLTAIPSASLPLVHGARMDLSPADTGTFALIDSIRTVRVTFTTVYHDPRNGDVYRTVATTIRILNAGLAHAATCGDPPIGVAPTFTTSAAGDTIPYVTLNWPASVDEHSGQKSVERYMLYRRLASAAAFTESFATIPAGQASYAYTDLSVRSGDSLYYGVSAQDCTPANSPIGGTTLVVVP